MVKCRLGSSTSVSLTRNLTEIPTQILSLVRLEELNLSGNYLTHITEELYVLKNLRKLDLSHNLIRFIAPRGIENLKKLEYFNLEDNLLSELPFGLGEILKLKELNIMENLFVSCFSFPHYTLAKNGTTVKVQWEKGYM